MWTYKDLLQTLVHFNLNIDRDFVHVGEPLHKQAVGGRPPRYAPPRPATEAGSGSLESGRPSRARSANTRHPAGRPHTPPVDRMYATDLRQTVDRQTDVRQHHRLMPPGRGHNNFCLI